MNLTLTFVYEQRVTKMNKTEDDELDTEGLTEAELRQVAGQCSSSSFPPVSCPLTLR